MGRYKVMVNVGFVKIHNEDYPAPPETLCLGQSKRLARKLVKAGRAQNPKYEYWYEKDGK